MIAASPAVHRLKGTRGAVERAVAAVWDGAEVEEWFEYGGDPYKFKVRAEVTSAGFSQDDWDLIVKVALATKNVRSHLDTVSLSLTNQTRTPLFGAATLAINTLEVFPRSVDELTQNSAVPLFGGAAVALHIIEVYP